MISNGASLLARSHNCTLFSRKRRFINGIPGSSLTRSFIARSSQRAFLLQSQVSQTSRKFPFASTHPIHHASSPAPTTTAPSGASSRLMSNGSVIVSEVATGLSAALIVMLSGSAAFFIHGSVRNTSAATDCQRQDEVNDKTATPCIDKSENFVLATSAITMADPSYRSDAALSSDGKEAAVVTEKTRSYEVSVRALKGNRITMEDEYVVNDKGNFAAVFDGHGGSGVSRYLRETLQDRMRYFLNDEVEVYKEDNEEVKKTKRFLNFLKRQSPGPTIEKIAAALQSAFRSIDREVMMNDRFHYQGSTAVAVLVLESENESKTLLAANIGDSRAVLSRCKCALNLTRDHKPHLTSEKARIESMGEKVEWDGYLYRVRDLSLSRAIGDRHAKPAVSGEIEISQFPVKEGDEFVIIASDGLWDVISSQEAVDFVHQKLKYSIDSIESTREIDQAWTRHHMSRFLANEAMDRGTGDNVCVLIMWLNDFNERSKVDT